MRNIPKQAVKRMLLAWATGSARQEIMEPTGSGLAFENYETGEFFTEMLKKFSQEKDKEAWKQEYTARKQRRNEDPRKYCTDKLEL